MMNEQILFTLILCFALQTSALRFNYSREKKCIARNANRTIRLTTCCHFHSESLWKPERQDEFYTSSNMGSPEELGRFIDYFDDIESRDYEEWYSYEAYEDDREDCQDEDEEEEEQRDDEVSEEVDILAGYMTQYEEKRAKELAAKAEAKKEQLRLLIGIKEKEDGDVSEETLVTPEEKTSLSSGSSSESSIHPCLKDIEISDSRLKLKNLYTQYPVPDDPGLVPAFWTIHEEPPAYKSNVVQKFFDLAKKSNLRPIQSMKEMLLTDRINLQYYGVDSRIVRVICEALEGNTSVQTINLKDNWLSIDACYHLNQLLLRNTIVSALMLHGCRIGAAGVEKLFHGISQSTSLKMLDLSGCNVGSEGLAKVAAAMCDNRSIENLVLSNNQLDESCSKNLLPLLSDNETLKSLELAWNSLYMPTTWKMMVKGFEINKSLTELDLSWNALGYECVPYLNQLMSRSLVLEKLDLSGNRFDDNSATSVAKALSKNKVLQELKLGNNPIKAPGALALVRALIPQKSPDSALRILSLTNIWAEKDVLPELEAIKNGRPWLDITLGGILSNYKLVGPDSKSILLKRANYEAMKPKKKKLRKNFGHFVLSLTDNPVPTTKFKEFVKNFRLKLSETLIEEIMNSFAGPKNTVDLGLLKSVYLEQYPETKPMPEKAVKSKSKKGKERSKQKEKVN